MKITRDNEKLVQASLYPEKILVRSWYFGEGLPGSLPEAWLREGVYERLLLAAESLPDNLRFVIWDGWRSYELQKFLFDTLYSRAKAKGLDDESAYALTRTFVAVPSKEPESVSGHLTGGSIDLTLADMYGRYLDMGGNFDETEEHSATGYYEKSDLSVQSNVNALNNRRLLVSIMTGAGFVNNPNEWWHYDYGNRRWAELTGSGEFFYGYTEPPFKWH
ncbi:MAG: M15 family metallopeptidase [Synergistaceae bacterium]|nr:M15 family metallopeptidase [Synergistaceae bacterium]